MPRRRPRQRPAEVCYPAQDARVTARFVRLRSGLTVRVVESGPPDGRPIVLLPGLGVSAFTYRHQLPALGGAGYRASAVDLKGHGFSDKPTGRGEYTFDAMVAHVREVIDAIARRPAVIVAQSMAGAIAIELAAAHREAVAALILLAPVGLGVVPFARAAPLLTPRLLDPIAPRLVRRWIVRAGLALVYANAARVSEDTVDEYWAPAQFPDYSRAVRALIHDFRWTPFSEAKLAELDRRTLIVLGSRDRVVRDSLRRAKQLSGPTVTLIEDGGHAVNEERPELVNEAILGFLRSLEL